MPVARRSRPFLWLAAAAAVVLAFFSGVALVEIEHAASGSPVAVASPAGILVSCYAPDELVKMEASYDAGVDAVVIVLDGLPEVAKPDDLLGFGAGDPRDGLSRLAGAPPRESFREGSQRGLSNDS